MTGRDMPALYEDPSRLSRMVVISCAVVAALLTFLMILPPLLTVFGHRSVKIDNPASTARTAAAASLDQLSQTAKPTAPQTANPIPPAGAVPAASGSSTAAIAETSRPVVSSGVETPQRVPPEPPAPPTNGRSPENPSAAWVATIQSPPDPGPTVEVDAEPVAPPPLPRIRPHHMTVDAIAAIPLPSPRPAVPTESASTDREATHERLDPF